MDAAGSGGMGLVAVPWWMVVVVLLVVGFAAWKLVKFLWAMFGS